MGVTNGVDKALTVSGPNTNKIILKVTTTTGVVGLSFKDPNDHKTDHIKGVLLQNQAMAAGLFYRTNAGQFLLEQTP
jgi:hypothetical protein